MTAGRPLQSVAMSTEQRTDHLSASPPLFESRFLDFFSRVHPSIPAIIFVPVVVIGVWAGLDRGYDVLQVAGLFLAGLLIWTFSEYWLHRTVFHWEPDHPLGSRLHFIMHGVHHEHPNDPLRLVMPPAVSIPLAALFFGLFALDADSPPDLLMHLAPAAIVLTVVALAWRAELIGAAMFLVFAAVYALNARDHISWVAAISGPLAPPMRQDWSSTPDSRRPLAS